MTVSLDGLRALQEAATKRNARWRKRLEGYEDKEPLCLAEVLSEESDWIDDYVTLDELETLPLLIQEIEGLRVALGIAQGALEFVGDYETLDRITAVTSTAESDSSR